VSVDAALVNGQCAALAGVGRVKMSNLETLAAFGAQRFEGLLPLRIRGPFRRLVSGGEDPVFVIVALLDNRANLFLENQKYQ
jgi:hypothetical protein